ncbi:OmpW/AlkL family protein [Zavarzinia sp. CC-PAN008]|uniref:OmpW/AlkL family protein n=1 Tax=Zavarzinia sp. CC-PAN008 TaxID=3243332 RepID=UPI003F742E12
MKTNRTGQAVTTLRTLLGPAMVGALAVTALVTPALVTPAHADVAGQFQVRGRMLAVIPDESASVTVVGGDAEIDNSYVPEVDLTWFLTNNLALELIAATTPHEVKHVPTNLDMGEVWLLPPTLTLQYHLQPEDPVFRPYVGVGVNYTFFYNQNGAQPGIKVDYEDGWGWALQAGADVPIGDNWSLNIDVKKIFIDTEVTIRPLNVNADVDIDPWVVGIGVTWRFGL